MKQQLSSDKFDRMTKTPVSKLVLTLGLPTTVSMLVTNIYNMADTYFVGQCGTSASGAIGVVFALMAIIQAFGFTYGQGAGSLLSRHLGAKETEAASRYSSTSFFLAIVTGLVIMLLGFCFLNPLMWLLGSTETILPYARIYASCILLAAPAMVGSCVLNNILRYEGIAVFAMIGLASGGLLNIFGDWLLMAGVWHLGILGAGIATTISQYVSFFILLSMFLRHKTQSALSLKYLSLDKKTVMSIVSVGSPSMARQGLNSISTMVLNNLAGGWGDAAVAAMSIVGKISNFLFCIGIGIGQGFQPVSAFNYGAGNYKRVRNAFTFTAIFGTCLLSVIGVFGYVFSPALVRWMRDDDAVVAIGTIALQAQSLSMWSLSFAITVNMLFQSIGKAVRAFLMSSMRSGLCFIPLLFILTPLLGLTGIEIAQPLANILSFLISIPFLVSFFRQMPKEDAPLS